MIRHKEQMKESNSRIWDLEEGLRHKNSEIKHLQALLSQQKQMHSAPPKVEFLQSGVHQRNSDLEQKLRVLQEELQTKEIQFLNLKGEMVGNSSARLEEMEALRNLNSEIRSESETMRIKISEYERGSELRIYVENLYKTMSLFQLLIIYILYI